MLERFIVACILTVFLGIMSSIIVGKQLEKRRQKIASERPGKEEDWFF